MNYIRLEDTHRDKEPLKLTKSTYMDGHLGSWYIKLAFYNRFLYWNKILKKVKQLLEKLRSS